MIKKILTATIIVMIGITAYRLYEIEKRIDRLDNTKCYIRKNK